MASRVLQLIAEVQERGRPAEPEDLILLAEARAADFAATLGRVTVRRLGDLNSLEGPAPGCQDGTATRHSLYCDLKGKGEAVDRILAMQGFAHLISGSSTPSVEGQEGELVYWVLTRDGDFYLLEVTYQLDVVGGKPYNRANYATTGKVSVAALVANFGVTAESIFLAIHEDSLSVQREREQRLEESAAHNERMADEHRLLTELVGFAPIKQVTEKPATVGEEKGGNPWRDGE